MWLPLAILNFVITKNPVLNSNWWTLWTGLKKWKFRGKLVEISRGPQIKDDCFFMTSQKEFVSLKTLHSKGLNYHCVHTHQLGLVSLPASVHIQRVNSCIAAVYHATALYAKNEILKDCKTDGSGKCSPQSDKFSRLILV